MTSLDDAERLKELRKKIFITAINGGISHLASAFSCLEIIYTLYMKGAMKFDPCDPDMPHRDRLVLSKGHGGLALYAVMCEAGYFSDDKLKTYLKSLGGEPSMRDLRGIEASTGSLGHGLSVAAGMAMAQKMDDTCARTFAIIGDGECQEGTIWECAISASALGLDNLVAILDCNGLQKMCETRETMKNTNWREKFEAFGWLCDEADGHDVDEMKEILTRENSSGKPLLLIAHTVKGKGVSIMENNPVWHFKLPNKKETKIFKNELGILDGEM